MCMIVWKHLKNYDLMRKRGCICLTAVRLLAKQEEDCNKTGTCSVCLRSLPSKKMTQQCARRLHAKKESVERVRHEEAVHLHEACVAAMNDLETKVLTFPTPSSTRLAFYLRTGELSEWRQQKLDCMSSMACFACSRVFTSEDFSSFLKRVDHRAASMERELHIHPKFCPFETLESDEAPNVKRSKPWIFQETPEQRSSTPRNELIIWLKIELLYII